MRTAVHCLSHRMPGDAAGEERKDKSEKMKRKDPVFVARLPYLSPSSLWAFSKNEKSVTWLTRTGRVTLVFSRTRSMST